MDHRGDVLDQLPQIVWISRPDGFCDWMNRFGLSYVGRELEEVTAMQWNAFVHRDDLESLMRELAVSALEHRPLRHEVRLRRADGDTRWHLLTATPISIGTRLSGWIGTAVDVQDQREYEARLRRTEQTEAVSALAAGVAHHFNNLLAIVIANAEIVSEEGPPSLGEPVKSIVHAAQRLAVLAEQLLSFSRSRSTPTHKLILDDAIGDLHPLLAEVLGDRNTLELDLDAGEATILCDTSQLRQILVNLLTTSRAGMPAGGGGVTIQTSTRADSVVIEVRDNAARPITLTRSSFEPMRATGGIDTSGFALYVVQHLVKNLGGAIDIGAGSTRNATTFAISLPRIASIGPEPEPLRGQGETVLVVDDVPEVLSAIARSIRRLGYTVHVADSGALALDLLAETPVDVVVSDISMPEMTGFELAERAIQKHRARVILMTGYDEMPLVERQARELPVIPKPFATAELSRLLRRVLREPGAVRS